MSEIIYLIVGLWLGATIGGFGVALVAAGNRSARRWDRD